MSDRTDEECQICGVGFNLPSGRCDHCNSSAKAFRCQLCGGYFDHVQIRFHTCANRTSNPPTSPEAAVIEERGKVYGDPQASHANIGLAWTGLLQQHYGIQFDHALPAWLVAQMMVMLKVNRAARVFKDDNFLDLKVYAGFAEAWQGKEREQ